MSATLIGVDRSRRSFLRGQIQQPAPALRPPWALPEENFLSLCTQCGQCETACPTNIIQRGDGGFPSIDFQRGECNFCVACVTTCTPRALFRKGNGTPWTQWANINKNCLARKNIVCQSCGDVCEEGAIRFRPQLGAPAQPQVENTCCTGCGACVATCPVKAIEVCKQQGGNA